MSGVHEDVRLFRNDCRGDHEHGRPNGRKPLVAERPGRRLLAGPAVGQFVGTDLLLRERIRDLDRERAEVFGDLVHIEVHQCFECREGEMARAVDERAARRVPTASLQTRPFPVERGVWSAREPPNAHLAIHAVGNATEDGLHCSGTAVCVEEV